LDEKELEISVFDKSKSTLVGEDKTLVGEVKVPLHTIFQGSNVNEADMAEEHPKYGAEQAFYVIQPKRNIAPDSCSMQSDKVIKYPDGSKQIEKGRYVLSDGTLKQINLADKKKNILDKELKDDCIKFYDGTVLLPSEAILRRDGKLRTPDNKITEPAWQCHPAPLPFGASQDMDYQFWINDLSIIEPNDSDVGLAFGIINLHMYRSGPEVIVRILEARGLPAKRSVFVMMDLSTDVEGSLKHKNKCLSLSVKDIATRSLYKKSALMPSSSPVKVPKTPVSSPNRNPTQSAVVSTPSVSSLASTSKDPSLGPFKTKGQKRDRNGIFRYDDFITLKLQSEPSNKYVFKDKCLTVTLWEKKRKVQAPENIGVLFLDVALFPESRENAGDRWLAFQPPPPV